ncbi:hypothetical protein HUJ04_006299 [Dendroctonus ponderosae]|nr:hypothetical protein HUJ04_006299 [Dendroctonus ponderosae]
MTTTTIKLLLASNNVKKPQITRPNRAEGIIGKNSSLPSYIEWHKYSGAFFKWENHSKQSDGTNPSLKLLGALPLAWNPPNSHYLQGEDYEWRACRIRIPSRVYEKQGAILNFSEYRRDSLCEKKKGVCYTIKRSWGKLEVCSKIISGDPLRKDELIAKKHVKKWYQHDHVHLRTYAQSEENNHQLERIPERPASHLRYHRTQPDLQTFIIVPHRK